MSEPENFLTRWSRRKQETERERQEPVAPNEKNAPAPADAPVAGTNENEADKSKKPEFDLSTLPSLDSIGAGTDVRAFLQKGVPLELTRAALRRAWTSDPAIRDFIEVAENQWDFATGSDIPGFGPLEPSEEIRRMVEAMFEAPAVEADTSKDSGHASEAEAAENAHTPANEAALSSAPETPITSASTATSGCEDRQDAENIASQQHARSPDHVRPNRRRHGGALPE